MLVTLPGCGGGTSLIQGPVEAVQGITLTLRIDGRPVAVGAFFPGLVIFKAEDRYGWLTDGYDIGRVTIRETTAKISGQRPDVSTSVIAISSTGSHDVTWNLSYGRTPSLSIGG